MDVLFLEHIEFEIPLADYGRVRVASSQEEVLRAAMACVGVELIDYGSFTAQPVVDNPPRLDRLRMRFNAFSKAYRARAERASPR